jgi:hypothetical protein
LVACGFRLKIFVGTLVLTPILCVFSLSLSFLTTTTGAGRPRG